MKKAIIASCALGLFSMLAFSALHYHNLASLQKAKVEVVTQQNRKLAMEAEQLRNQLAQMHSRFSNIEKRVSAAPPQAKTPESPPLNTTDEQEGEPSDTAIPPEEWVEPEQLEPAMLTPEKQRQAEMAFMDLEATFTHEPLDYQWTDKATAQLLSNLKERHISDSTLDQVECHSSICQAAFVHADDAAHDALLHHLGSMAMLTGGFLVKTDEFGPKPRTLVYFPREGEKLPLPMDLITSGETP